MAVTPILEVNEVAPTQTDKTVTINDAIVALEAAFNDQLSVDMSGGNVTLSWSQFSRHAFFVCTGATADRALTIPLTTPTGALPAKRFFTVRNGTSHNVTVGGVTGSTVTIAAGDAAALQSDGTNCYGYATGGAGPTGPAGPAGGVAIAYTFSTTTTNADPGTGVIRLNNATQNAATAIYIDLDDSSGTTWTSVLDSLDDSGSVVRGLIRLYKATDTTKWIVFQLTAVLSHTGYRELTVSVVGASSATPFADTDPLAFTFTRSGDVGSVGGAISILYTFSSTTTNADPGTGNLRLNNITENAATAIYADAADVFGIDWTGVLDQFDDSTSTTKGYIRLVAQSDLTKWLVFAVTALVSHTGYREITVSIVASSSASPFIDTDPIVLTFTRTGDQGATGATGGTDTYASGITAAGTTQGTATAITSDINVVNTVASNTGVILQSSRTKRQRVLNRGANVLKVYPNSGAQIEGLGTNVAATVAAGGVADFYPDSSTQWYAA